MILDDSTFMFYATKLYDAKRTTGMDEFMEDMKRFQYLKRLFNRFPEDGELKTRLILNHLIIIYNCFGPMATNMLFFKLKEHHSLLKPFVVFLNFMPENIEYEGLVIPSSSIGLNQKVVDDLRAL